MWALYQHPCGQSNHFNTDHTSLPTQNPPIVSITLRTKSGGAQASEATSFTHSPVKPHLPSCCSSKMPESFHVPQASPESLTPKPTSFPFPLPRETFPDPIFNINVYSICASSSQLSLLSFLHNSTVDRMISLGFDRPSLPPDCQVHMNKDFIVLTALPPAEGTQLRSRII